MVKKVGAKDVPENVEIVIERVRKLASFNGWDGKTTFTVVDIKTYCVPGNLRQVQGQMAIWVRGAKAKQTRIIFAPLVLLAMRFIADPQVRGSNPSLHVQNFRHFIREHHPEWDLRSMYDNGLVYFALARRLLRLPDNYQDQADAQIGAREAARSRAARPNIYSSQGLLSETIIAYISAMAEIDPITAGNPSSQWASMVFGVLWGRHSSMQWNREELREYLQETYDELRSNPDHQDIRDVPIAAFAMLYANGLAFTTGIRYSAATSVVNKLIDAFENGALGHVDTEIARLRQSHHQQTADLEAAFASLLSDSVDEETKSAEQAPNQRE